MAPGPKMLTPAEMAAQGVKIAANEVAYREGKAFVLFTTPTPNPDKAAPSGSGSGIVVPGGQGPDAAAFLNPVQEFNRDLSICAIRTWQADMQAERQHRRHLAWIQKQAANERKAAKRKNRQAQDANSEQQEQQQQPHQSSESSTQATGNEGEQPELATPAKPQGPPTLPVQRFTILEALAATGLRSIRYAKEIDTVKWILANDISASAITAMRRNVALNFPESKEQPAPVVAETEPTPVDTSTASNITTTSKVRINEGDALSLMYSHRTNDMGRFDVIDLDPYGSASMFLDATVQSVADGGLLCVTCTDLAVLAGGQYPEKSFTLYGGMNLRSEHGHELALRLLLHSIASNAARYGRVIQPVLSLSIDFYVRVFVRVYTSVAETKHLASQSALSWTCQSCSNTAHLPMARTRVGPPAKNGQDQLKFSTAGRPPVGSHCELCGGSYLMAGPYWTGPLHDTGFCTRLLNLVQREEANYRTAPRIIGMVSTAAEELGNANQPDPAKATPEHKLPLTPSSRPGEQADLNGFLSTSSERSMFYFTSAQISRAFHGTSAPLPVFVHALLNAGYEVSRSHCLRGSLKTTAPFSVVHDIYRYWLRQQQDKEASEATSKEEKPAQDDVHADAVANDPTTPSLVGRTIEISKRVKAQNERAPAYVLSSQAIQKDWNLNRHPGADQILLPQLPGSDTLEYPTDSTGGQVTETGEHFHRKVGPKRTRIVRYQENPMPNWGPATAARMTPGTKSKRPREASSSSEANQADPSKRAKEN